MNSGVYLIQNIVSAEFYVGATVNIRRRWSEHISTLKLEKHANRRLQSSWKKYGAQSFRFYKIIDCDKAELLRFEQFYINQLKPEYNILQIAGSSLGAKASDETRKKMSETRKLVAQSPEWRKKVSEGTKKGFSKNPDAIQKIKAAREKNIQDPEWHRKVSEGSKKAYLDPEVYKRKCEVNKKNAQNLESRRKMSEARKGKKPSIDHYQKQIEGIKRYWAEKKNIEIASGSALAMT